MLKEVRTCFILTMQTITEANSLFLFCGQKNWSWINWFKKIDFD